jgi:hypothetical protein
MYKLVFFVPEAHVETVKTALFAVGAGRMGHYDCCAWQTLGIGQFRPLAGSQPFIGSSNQLMHVSEYRVEMVCADEHIAQAVDALRKAHPYEEPAYDVWRLAEF